MRLILSALCVAETSLYTDPRLLQLLLECPMCATPKKKAVEQAASDSFVSMYGAGPAAAQVPSQKLAMNKSASHIPYDKPNYRWAGAKNTSDPYPHHY
jgi:hypothetical protein